MEDGVNAWGEENGVNASLVGPAEADAAQQIPIIEDLIAQGVVVGGLEEARTEVYQRLLDGDESAFVELVEAYQGKVYTLLLRITDRVAKRTITHKQVFQVEASKKPEAPRPEPRR